MVVLVFNWIRNKLKPVKPEPIQQEIVKDGENKMNCPICNEEIVNIPAAYAFLGQYGKCLKCWQAETSRLAGEYAMRNAVQNEAQKKALLAGYQPPAPKGQAYDIPLGTKPGEAFAGGRAEQLAENAKGIENKTIWDKDPAVLRQKTILGKAGVKI